MLIENQESERKSINEVKDMLTQLIQAQKEDEKQKNYARDALNIAPPTPAEERAARWYMIYSVPVCLFYIHFMVRTDVPMYLAAWRADTAAGVTYNSFAAGLREMVRCDQLTTAFEPWREAIVWQTGYFAIMPLFTMFAYAYQLSEETATRHLDALIPEAKLEPTLTQLEPDRTSPWSMAARTKAD